MSSRDEVIPFVVETGHNRLPQDGFMLHLNNTPYLSFSLKSAKSKQN